MNGPTPIMLVMLSAVACSKPKRRVSDADEAMTRECSTGALGAKRATGALHAAHSLALLAPLALLALLALNQRFRLTHRSTPTV